MFSWDVSDQNILPNFGHLCVFIAGQTLKSVKKDLLLAFCVNLELWSSFALRSTFIKRKM